MRSTTVTIAIAAFCVVMALGGCGAGKTPQGQAAVSPDAGQRAETPAPSAPAAAGQTIAVYYGDASGSKLVEKSALIQSGNENAKYLETLKVLKKAPTADVVSLCPNTDFRSAELKNGTLTVDLSIPDSDKLGAGGEQMLLDAIQKTLFQFDEVLAIELLVEGKQAESLMGHLELPHPIKRK